VALREILADLVVRVRGTRQLANVQRSATGVVGSLRGAARALGAVGAAVTSALAVRQIAGFVTEVIDLGDETAKTARQLGISADELGRWRFAAERSGVDADSLANGMRRLQRNLVDASEGLSTPQRAFRDLGVSATDADGRVREMEDVIPELADAFGRLETDTQRSARAQQLFGRAGAQLLPFFDEGSAGLERLRARFEELGGVMGDDFFEDAEAAQDAMADWDVAMTSIRSSIVVSVLPAITRVVTTIAEWTATVRQALARSSAMQVALGALTVAAAALAIALAPVLATVLLLIAPFAILFLVVEDLVTMFRGGQSAIGDFIDAMFGAGAAESVVRTLTEAWEGLVHAIRTAYAAVTGGEAPTMSGRADVGGSVQEEGARQRRAAALRGELRGSRGQTYDDALAEANRYRAEAGMDPLERHAAMAQPTRAVAARSVAGGRAGDVHQAIDARTEITIQGGDPEATARAIERRRGGGLERAIAQAAARTPQAGDA